MNIFAFQQMQPGLTPPIAGTNTNLMVGLSNIVLGVFDRMRTSIYFLLILLLQVLLTFQGFDLSDEGFLAILYRQVFHDPESVSYNFLFWLTGIIGGTWEHFLPGLGIWGLRLFGALVNTATLIAAYQLLRPYISKSSLRLSLFLVITCLNNDIKIVNYNTLSSLNFVLIASLVHGGLVKGRGISLFLAGMLLTANVFIRIPNILQFGICAIILGYGWITTGQFNRAIKQIAILLAGGITAFLLLYLVMKQIGHWPIFTDSISYLTKMSDESNLEQNEIGKYGVFYMINEFRIGITKPLVFAISLLGVFGLIQWINNVMHRRQYQIASVADVLTNALPVLVAIILARLDLATFEHLFMLTGIAMLFFVPKLLSKKAASEKLLAWIGIYFMLTYPLGSASGIYTAGRFALWIALPFALDYFIELRSFMVNFRWRHRKETPTISLSIDEPFLDRLRSGVLVLLVVVGIYNLYNYPFFDWNNRARMTASIDNPHLKGIFTTPERAELLNEVFGEVSRRTRKNDYIFAYAHISAIYYCTDTRPFIRNPLPGVYKSAIFREDLYNSLKKRQFYPLVVRQTMPTTGPASGWPAKNVANSYAALEEHKGINGVMDRFISENNYQVVWSNPYFEILETTKKY